MRERKKPPPTHALLCKRRGEDERRTKFGALFTNEGGNMGVVLEPGWSIVHPNGDVISGDTHYLDAWLNRRPPRENPQPRNMTDDDDIPY